MTERPLRWVHRGLAIVGGTVLSSGSALAHEGGHSSAAPVDWIAVASFLVGTVLVSAGVLADRGDRLPRTWTNAAVLLGAMLVLLSIPLFWS